MSHSEQPSLPERLADARGHEAVLRQAVRAAVIAQAQAGLPVAASRNGQVVWIQPAEILARFSLDATTAEAG